MLCAMTTKIASPRTASSWGILRCSLFTLYPYVHADPLLYHRRWVRCTIEFGAPARYRHVRRDTWGALVYKFAGVKW